MQNFSPLALKLREKIEDGKQVYCKNAKFLKTPIGADGENVYSVGGWIRIPNFSLKNSICNDLCLFVG